MSASSLYTLLRENIPSSPFIDDPKQTDRQTMSGELQSLDAFEHAQLTRTRVSFYVGIGLMVIAAILIIGVAIMLCVNKQMTQEYLAGLTGGLGLLILRALWVHRCSLDKRTEEKDEQNRQRWIEEMFTKLDQLSPELQALVVEEAIKRRQRKSAIYDLLELRKLKQ